MNREDFIDTRAARALESVRGRDWSRRHTPRKSSPQRSPHIGNLQKTTCKGFSSYCYPRLDQRYVRKQAAMSEIRESKREN